MFVYHVCFFQKLKRSGRERRELDLKSELKIVANRRRLDATQKRRNNNNARRSLLLEEGERCRAGLNDQLRRYGLE